VTTGGDAGRGKAAGANGSHRVLLDTLRSGGAGRFDPVRLTFIESMARRAGEHGEPLSAILEARVQRELEALQADFARASEAAAALVTRSCERHPGARERLRLLFDRGDFRGVQRLAARLDRARGRVCLSALADRLAPGDTGGAAPEQGVPGPVADDLWRQEQVTVGSMVPAGVARRGFQGRPGGELKSVNRLRRSQGRRRAERLLAQAIREAPADSGPLNPQMLVIRTLSAMGEISPDYLGRLVSYVDTLFWLDAASQDDA